MSEMATEAEIEQWITQTATEAGREVPKVVWRDGGGAEAKRRKRRDVIFLGREDLTDDARIRHAAAHEMGHVLLGHTTLRGVTLPIIGLVGGLLLLVILGVIVVGMVAGPVVAPAGFSLGVIVWLALWARLALRWLKHPAEFAADAFAVRAGSPITPQLLAQGVSEEQTFRATLLGRVTAWLFPTHPHWEQRYIRQQTLLSTDD